MVPQDTYRQRVLVSLLFPGLILVMAVLASLLMMPTAMAGSFSCTQVIGFSQTMQWYEQAPDFEAIVGDDEWQLLAAGGAGIDSWANPGYGGWSSSIVSPCVVASANPERIVLTISGEPRSSLEWATAIDAATITIRGKYPGLLEIALQPVVGGPNHQVCPAPGGGGDVRASTSHPDIDQGIAMVVGGDVVLGASPEVRTCDDFEDTIGHLTPESRGPIGATIGQFYAGDAVGGIAELPDAARDSQDGRASSADDEVRPGVAVAVFVVVLLGLAGVGWYVWPRSPES